MHATLSLLFITLLTTGFLHNTGPSEAVQQTDTHRFWGLIGHRVVGQIAQNHLTPEAGRAVKELLNGDSMAEVSTWADEARGMDEYSYTAPWHYTTIPDGKTYQTAPKNPEGDVITALRKYERILKDADASKEQKAIALKFFIHFVGDIHQPLHVGNGKDRGGNDVKVNWYGENARLHRVWDSEIIRHMELSFTEFVLFLDIDDAGQIRKWQESDYTDWAMESYHLRNQVYDFKTTRRDEEPYLGWDYRNAAVSVVEQRLLHAGVRLAGKLNDFFS